MKVEQYYSDDYAGMLTGEFHFYYGYEREDPVTEEWMFEVKKNGKVIYTLTTLDIENQCETRQLRMPQDYLLAGIGIWMSTGD